MDFKKTQDAAKPDEKPVEVVEADDFVMFTSHPIGNLRLGSYQFTDGQLRLPAADVAAFEELLAKLPPIESARVNKIDVEAARETARAFLAGTTKTAGVATSESPIQ